MVGPPTESHNIPKGWHGKTEDYMLFPPEESNTGTLHMSNEPSWYVTARISGLFRDEEVPSGMWLELTMA